MPDLTPAELARRYGVARSTVTRALARARHLHEQAGDRPGGPTPPPAPVNPGEPQLRYRTEDMDPWWELRDARPGRPRAREAAQ